MPLIESVSVAVARVPLDQPISYSTRTVFAREYCLIKVRSTDGVEGLGYSYAVNSSGVVLATAVQSLLAPVVVGQDSLRVEGLWKDMYHTALLQGRAGAVMRGLSAIDIALWDLNARTAKLPLYKYLGAGSEDRVRAYGSGGYYVEGKSNDMLAREMADFVADGFTAVKMKSGRLSPSQEEARVAAAREAVGDDIELTLDINNGWQDFATAMKYVPRLEKYDLYWIEEPFAADDIANHARLARATRVPIATGEAESGRWRFKELIMQGAATILQTDATVCGGISEWRRIAGTAASFGIPMAPHAWHDIHVHLLGSVTNGLILEWMPDDHIVNFRRLIDRQLVAERGHVLIPQEPGLAFHFSEDALAKYGVVAAGESSPWTEIRARDRTSV